jgi:phosphorylcholine metabolism protein LicD|tara:strand:- start:506 stop:1153 length:648 start_codon:yes stop_codon:yes gene_type:complete
MLTKKIKTFKQLSTKVSLENNESNLVFFSKILIHVEYFIFFGTLLGITREKRLIDGDDDIDFYINLKDRNQLINDLKINNIEVDLSLSVNKNKSFLQVKRIVQNEILITDFYFYESDMDERYIIEKWNFEGGTHDRSKHLRIPKKFIYPLKKISFKDTVLFIPNEKELICEFLYGKNWDKKLKKDIEYEIKVINGRPYLYMVKKFLFFKRLILTL